MKNLLTFLFIYFIASLISLNCLAQDFADLAYFKTDNIQAGISAAGEKRVVFMGNSITEAWGKDYPDFFNGKPYFNRGISGQTTPQILLRFSRQHWAFYY